MKNADKPLLEKVDIELEREISILTEKLIDKLFILVNGKTSQGVNDFLNVEIIPKGKKFALKKLKEIDYININPTNWTTEDKSNLLIEKLLHNYSIRYKEIQSKYKRKKYCFL